MREKKGRKGKKVVVKDLDVKKVKGGLAGEDVKGGFNPQPEPPPREMLKIDSSRLIKVQEPGLKIDRFGPGTRFDKQ
jgi:hypothetical protein